MEKYSDWRDKGTGVSPFMPVPNTDDKVAAFKYGLKPLVILFKAPFLLLFGALLVVSAPVTPLYRAVLRLALAVLFNVAGIEFLVDGVKKSNIKTINAKRPSRSDLTFVNFSSPLDPLVLYLSARTGDQVFLYVDNRGNLRQIGSTWDCFRFALAAPTLFQNDDGAVTDLSLLSKKTVFLLVEGTTTNNKAILSFSPKFDLPRLVKQYNNVFRFKAISVKSLPTSVLSTPIPQSLVSFILSGLGNFRWNVRYTLKLFELGTDVTVRDVRDKMSNYGKLKLTGDDLSVEKKVQFIRAYKSNAK